MFYLANLQHKTFRMRLTSKISERASVAICQSKHPGHSLRLGTTIGPDNFGWRNAQKIKLIAWKFINKRRQGLVRDHPKHCPNTRLNPLSSFWLLLLTWNKCVKQRKINWLPLNSNIMLSGSVSSTTVRVLAKINAYNVTNFIVTTY